jgi:hypothetical protein
MALLAFNPDDPSPVSMLLDHSQRQKTASELNAAILTVQCQEKGTFTAMRYVLINSIQLNPTTLFRAKTAISHQNVDLGSEFVG